MKAIKGSRIEKHQYFDNSNSIDLTHQYIEKMQIWKLAQLEKIERFLE